VLRLHWLDIILGIVVLPLFRQPFRDLHVVINRSAGYFTPARAMMGVCLGLGTMPFSLFQVLGRGRSLLLMAVLTALIVVLVALLLRDLIQRMLDRFFPRSRIDFRKLLQEYSRTLTASVTLPRLLTSLANQAEEVFHPVGLVLAVADDGGEYRVRLCHGALAQQPLWREGAKFAPENSVPSCLKDRTRPIFLPKHLLVELHQPCVADIKEQTLAPRLSPPIYTGLKRR
jgi:hypothetical protein